MLVLLFICGLSSCSESDDSSVKKTPKIAVVENSNELLAVNRYCDENDGEVVKYSEVYDAVSAVENGVADYVALDEFTASTVINNGASLELYKKCDFSIKYCAYFTEDNKALYEDFNSVFKEMIDEGVVDDIKECHNAGEVYEVEMPIDSSKEIVMLCDPIFDNIIYYGEAGDVCGVDIDIAKVACSRLGYNLKIKVVTFEDLFISLEEGEGDMILSGMEYKNERASEFYASVIYNSTGFALYKRT